MTDVSADNPIFERPSRARRARRAFIRYVVAIGIGVAATLAWQSYGKAIKQIIAMRAPQLGWSPEAQQMIVAFIDELGWTKPPAAPDSAPGPASQAASLAQTAQGMGLITLQQTVDKLVARQDQMAHEIAKLQATDQEILDKVSAPSPQAAAAPPPMRTPPPSRTPMPPH